VRRFGSGGAKSFSPEEQGSGGDSIPWSMRPRAVDGGGDLWSRSTRWRTEAHGQKRMEAVRPAGRGGTMWKLWRRRLPNLTTMGILRWFPFFREIFFMRAAECGRGARNFSSAGGARQSMLIGRFTQK
jgi:hypothetical protein